MINKGTRLAEFIDGTSNTLLFTEAKTSLPVMRDGNNPNTPNATPPATPAAVVALGGTIAPNACHVQWVNGLIIQTGSRRR